MSSDEPNAIDWVILSTGERARALTAAVRSICTAVDGPSDEVIVVSNGAGSLDDSLSGTCARVVESEVNLGVPGGRDLGIASATTPIVGFLDDDAVLQCGAAASIRAAFDADPRLGAVAMRVRDERGTATRRHIPLIGGAEPTGSVDVAYFVGCAHALRREAYDDVGGYFTDLFYGHEEIELCWRLLDAGWNIRYLADAPAFHPRTEISRHARGWELTGRNRVLIARRTLPWPVAISHVTTWLVLGAIRAPGRTAKSSYLRGWLAGWRKPVDREPIGWRTVVRLCRLGRPPVV